jgi:predicted MFS family arabinose efflux permease
MVATGLGYAAAGGYATVLLIACFGTINPSAGSASVFVPLEHAVLSGTAAPAARTAAFARYSLIGTLASAAGALAAGVPNWLAALGVDARVSLRAMFVAYAALGAAAACMYRGLRPQGLPRAPAAALGPSRRTVYKLAALFSLDAFAGGFVVQSLLALWLFRRFDLSLAAAGALFFCLGVLAAVSFPVAARLAARIGLVNTMVFTHLPSSLFLMAAPSAPSAGLAAALFLAREGLVEMDVPTRQSFVLSIVRPDERTYASGVTNLTRTLGWAAGPMVAGAMMQYVSPAAPLYIGGALKIGYDLWLYREARATSASVRP